MLKSWLLKGGAIIDSKLNIKKDNRERSIQSTGLIKESTEILKIPKKLFIYSDMGLDTIYYNNLNRDMFNSLTKDKNIILLVFYLLQEYLKETESDFVNYFETLPTNINHIPIFWTEDELTFLNGSPILDIIQKRKIDLINQYSNLCLMSKEFKSDCNKSTFLWLRTIVGSRNFSLKINEKKQLCMFLMRIYLITAWSHP